MTALLACPECDADIPAELLADTDGVRLFAYCTCCGYATAEYDFENSFAGIPPAGVDWRGGYDTVVPFSQVAQ